MSFEYLQNVSKFLADMSIFVNLGLEVLEDSWVHHAERCGIVSRHNKHKACSDWNPKGLQKLKMKSLQPKIEIKSR